MYLKTLFAMSTYSPFQGQTGRISAEVVSVCEKPLTSKIRRENWNLPKVHCRGKE
jgi:hypothetical protein